MTGWKGVDTVEPNQMAGAFDQLLNGLRDLVEEQNAIWHDDPADETHDAIEEKFRADLEMGMATISQSVQYIAKSGNLDALASAGLLKTALDDVAYSISSYHVAPVFFDVLSDHFRMTEDLYAYSNNLGGIDGPLNFKLLRSAIQNERRPFKTIQTALTDELPFGYFKILSVCLQELKPVTDAGDAVLVSRFFRPLAKHLGEKLSVEDAVAEMVKLMPVLEPHLAALMNYSPKLPENIDDRQSTKPVNMNLLLPINFWVLLFEKTGSATVHQAIEEAMFFPSVDRAFEQWAKYGFSRPQAWHDEMQSNCLTQHQKHFWLYAIEAEGVELCEASVWLNDDLHYKTAIQTLSEARLENGESYRKAMLLMNTLVDKFSSVKKLRELVLKSEIPPLLFKEHDSLLKDRFVGDLGM
jgi:hypothetical protein